MYDIDAEVLISLVESKPVLWDKTLDLFKDRNAKRRAWSEVCLALKPDFEELENNEKNMFGKEVMRRWTNLRDCYAKSNKATKDDKKSGSAAKKARKYVFTDQMQFLNKLYHARDTTNSLENNTGGNSGEVLEEDVDTSAEPTAEDPGSTNQIQTSRTPATNRKHKKPDEFELKLLKVLEPKPVCSKMSFLQSLMPHLEKYDGNDFLQFQIGVLKVIEEINTKKHGLFMPIRNPVVNHPQPHQQPAFPPQQSAFPNQQSAFPNQQSAFPPQQSTFPPQQSTFPRQQSTFPHQQPAFPTQQSAFPSQQPAFSSQFQMSTQKSIPSRPQSSLSARVITSPMLSESTSGSPSTTRTTSALSEEFDFGDDYHLSNIS